jgi:hypothetical protein
VSVKETRRDGLRTPFGATVDPQNKSRTRTTTTTRRICSKPRASLKVVGRGSVRTGACRPALEKRMNPRK